MKTTELKPCPFCGGPGMLVFRAVDKHGKLHERKWSIRATCKACGGAAQIVRTDFLPDCNPLLTEYSESIRNRAKLWGIPEKTIFEHTERIYRWAEKAIEVWNRREGSATDAD